MTTYRVQKRLSTGHQPGDIVADGNFREDVAVALVGVGALKIIDGPPLTELPGWTRRAELLARVGIMTADQFLEADGELIRCAVEYHSVKAVVQWKEDVRRWLMPPSAKRKK